MAKESPPASQAVRDEWLRRIEAEYTSSAVTQNFTLWLTQLGASPDLVREGLRISWDEMMHARLSHKTYVAAGGDRMPALVREHLGLALSPGEPLEEDVLRVTVRTFCIGETVAVPLFKRLRERCTVPTARRALDRVLRDEVRHRDFGWATLTWMLEGPKGDALRARLVAGLPHAFAGVRGAYAGSARGSFPDADRAWGLMAPVEYAAVVDRTLERDWIPRFRALDVDARAAWDRATTLGRAREAPAAAEPPG